MEKKEYHLLSRNNKREFLQNTELRELVKIFTQRGALEELVWAKSNFESTYSMSALPRTLSKIYKISGKIERLEKRIQRDETRDTLKALKNSAKAQELLAHITIVLTVVTLIVAVAAITSAMAANTSVGIANQTLQEQIEASKPNPKFFVSTNPNIILNTIIIPNNSPELNDKSYSIEPIIVVGNGGLVPIFFQGLSWEENCTQNYGQRFAEYTKYFLESGETIKLPDDLPEEVKNDKNFWKMSLISKDSKKLGDLLPCTFTFTAKIEDYGELKREITVMTESQNKELYGQKN